MPNSLFKTVSQVVQMELVHLLLIFKGVSIGVSLVGLVGGNTINTTQKEVKLI